VIVIIGSGLAGYVLAQEIRRIDQQVRITIVSQDCGRYYLKPPLSSMNRSSKNISDIIMGQADVMAIKLKVDVLPSTQVVEVNRKEKKLKFLSGKSLFYTNLIFAVGAGPIDFICRDQPLRVNSLNDYEGAHSILTKAKSLTIIGSGLIGTEFAHDWSVNRAIHWVSSTQYPLQGILPVELGSLHRRIIEKEGVGYYHRNVDDIQCNNGKWEVFTASGVIRSEAVLMAIGLKPRVELAKSAGLDCNRGIVVDQYGRTQDPCVYALGDCAEVCGQWHAYVAPLRVAAKSIAKTLLGQETAIEWPAFPVLVKSPLLPTVVCLHPNRPKNIQWDVDISGSDSRALCVHEGQIWGFALTGSLISERVSLLKQMLPFLKSQ
jgi:rubredoxin---NAD+ reductase